jgi:hypothetical protein
MARNVLLFALLTAVAMLLPGCGKLGVLFAPDPRPLIPAQYELPRECKKIAVVIDDFRIETGQENLRERTAEQIELSMKANGAAARGAEFIPYSNIRSIETVSPEGKKHSIKHIGEALGADTVIYIDITQFDLAADTESPLVMPEAQARVKVLNIKTGERLWPIDFAGQPVYARERRQTEQLENSNRQEWSEKLAELLGTRIAELFYSHREEQ